MLHLNNTYTATIILGINNLTCIFNSSTPIYRKVVIIDFKKKLPPYPYISKSLKKTVPVKILLYNLFSAVAMLSNLLFIYYGVDK